MYKGTLSNGFKYKVNEKLKKDARFLELLRRATRLEKAIEENDENPDDNAEYMEIMFDIVDKMLGVEQKEKLYKHLEDKEGFVDFAVVLLCTEEILTALQNDSGAVKNL